MAVAAALMAVPAQAQATDWWLVHGEPGGSAAIFIDADSVVESNGAVTFRMERIQRDGPAADTTAQLRCDAPARPGEEEAVRHFVCATEEERMNSALIVSPMTPRETARLIFAMPRQYSGTPAGNR